MPERLNASPFTGVMPVEAGEPRKTAGAKGNISVVSNELLSPRKQPLKDPNAHRQSTQELLGEGKCRKGLLIHKNPNLKVH